jgi:hypothetical protein
LLVHANFPPVAINAPIVLVEEGRRYATQEAPFSQIKTQNVNRLLGQEQDMTYETKASEVSLSGKQGHSVQGTCKDSMSLLVFKYQAQGVEGKCPAL